MRDWFDDYLDGMNQYKIVQVPPDSHVGKKKHELNLLQKKMLFDAAAISEAEMRILMESKRDEEMAHHDSHGGDSDNKKTAAAPARTYLYKATGSGLSPDINNLRFYDTGLTNNGQPVYYDETNTYKMQDVGAWVINSVVSGAGLFVKIAGSGPTGSYVISAGGWSGTPTIVAI